MAVSTIGKAQRLGHSTNTYSGTKTIPSSGYLSLGNIGGSKFIISMIISSWGSKNGNPALYLGSGNILYLVGREGDSITDFSVRYNYYDN